jgi:serine/threonine protein kinase
VPIGREVAVKICLDDPQNDLADPVNAAAILREVRILATVAHPGCLSLIGFTPLGSLKRPRPAIVTEWMEHGSIESVIQKELNGAPVRGWNATKKSMCIFGIISALKYVHSLQLMHRDLKLENVLLNNNFEPVICDFGLSAIVQAGRNQTMNIGTPLYMAPELFGDDFGDQYGFPVDIYAYGICLIRMFKLDLTFAEEPKRWKSVQNFLLRVGKGVRYERPPGISDFLWGLIERCWAHNPSARLTAAEIVELLKSHRSEYAVAGTNLAELEAYEKRTAGF